MDDHKKTKVELIKELQEFRQKTRKLKASDADVKKIEEALRKIRDFNPSLLNTIGMNIVDLEGNIMLMNKELETLFGKEAVGKKCWKLYNDHQKECKGCPRHMDLKLGETRTLEVEEMFGGKTYQVTYTSTKYKGKKALMEMFQNITERKQYEKALKARTIQQEIVAEFGQFAISTQKLSSIFEKAAFYTAQGHNVEIAKILELLPDRKTLLLRADSDWKGPTVDPGTEALAMYTLLSTGPVLIQDLQKDTHFKAHGLFDKDIKSLLSLPIEGRHQPFGVISVCSKECRTFCMDDVHFLEAIANILAVVIERQEAGSRLIRARKLESVGVLAGGIAHDFNNIMTAILGNISLVKMDMNTEDVDFERLSEAEEAVLRAKDLTYQLLTFSQRGEPVRSVVSMPGLLKESVLLALKGSNVSSELSIPEDLWNIEADPGLISQVFRNLVVNADQAMPEGGHLRVSAENVMILSQDRLPIEEGNYVKVSVKDEGKGIPEEDVSKIFDPYFTTRQMGNAKGQGLGLAIAYSIINDHEGFIDVRSKVGEGSTFTIYLPACGKAVAKKEDLKKDLVYGKGRVLVMDDEELVRHVAGEMLKHLGYEVTCAADGDEAITLCKKAKTSGHPFDAVLVDLTIPGGMGGKKALQKLLDIDPHLRAIVSSGYSNDPVLINHRKYGFRAMIMKPYRIQELSTTLDRVISGGAVREKK